MNKFWEWMKDNDYRYIKADDPFCGVDLKNDYEEEEHHTKQIKMALVGYMIEYLISNGYPWGGIIFGDTSSTRNIDKIYDVIKKEIEEMGDSDETK